MSKITLKVGGLYVGENGWYWKAKSFSEYSGRMKMDCVKHPVRSSDTNPYYSGVAFYTNGQYPEAGVTIVREIQP